MAEKINVKAIRWFLDELQKLKAEGFLTEESASKWEQHYQAQLASVPDTSGRILRIFLGIICALLISGGLSLIVSHNWDHFPTWARLSMGFLAFVPGFIGGFYTLIKEKGTAWREASAIFNAIGIASSIAIVTQVYNLGGRMEDFLFIWMVLLIPLIFIFRSASAVIIYFIVYFFWRGHIGNWEKFDHELKIILFFLVPASFIIYTLWKEKTSLFAALCRYIFLAATLVFCIFFADYRYSHEMISLIFIALFGGLFVAGIESKDLSLVKNPFTIVSFLVLTITAVIYCIPETSSKFDSDSFALHYSKLPWSFALCGAVLLWSLIRSVLKRNFIFFVPLVLFVLIFLMKSAFFDDELMPFFTGALVLGCAVYALIQGFRLKRMLFLNAGLVLILGLILVWFFSSEWSIIVRGIAFMFAGLLFGAANFFFSKKLRKGEAK